MEVSGQLHAPAALSTRKEPPPPCPSDRLGRLQSRSGCYGEIKNLTCQESNSDSSAVKPISQSIHRAIPAPIIIIIITTIISIIII
jgi:hypothetical protein